MTMTDHKLDWNAIAAAKNELVSGLKEAGCFSAWVILRDYHDDESDLGNLQEFVVENMQYLRAAMAAATWPESVHTVQERLYRFGVLLGVPARRL